MEKTIFGNWLTSDVETMYMYRKYTYFVAHYRNHYCGYVVLPKSHKLAGASVDDIPSYPHMGLSYAEYDESGESYIIGFDCNHAGDTEQKCTVPYCVGECKSMIDDIIDFDSESAE